MPGARIFKVVVMKLMAPITDATQNSPMLTSHKSVPNACPGPAVVIALSGGYCVQPAPDAPPGTKNAAINTKNESRVIQNPDALSFGNAISETPNCSGRK